MPPGASVAAGLECDNRRRQGLFNSGELLRVGDRLEIVTGDGKTHQITVNGFGDGRIDGKEESIRVDQIVSLQKREYSGGKTWALVGGVVLLVVVGAIAASDPAPHFTP